MFLPAGSYAEQFDNLGYFNYKYDDSWSDVNDASSVASYRVILGAYTLHSDYTCLLNPFRLSFSEPKCARGGHIIFLESIFQHSPHEIVIYSINRNSYNKKK